METLSSYIINFGRTTTKFSTFQWWRKGDISSIPLSVSALINCTSLYWDGTFGCLYLLAQGSPGPADILPASWCTCTKCPPMDRDEDRVCCGMAPQFCNSIRPVSCFVCQIFQQLSVCGSYQSTRGPRGLWVAHLRKRSKATMEPIIENPRGIIWTTLVEDL